MPDLDFTGVDPADYIDATWDDQNGKPWRAHPNGMWYEYVEPITGGTTTFAELTDAATADLPALNTPLAAALALRQPITAVLTNTTASFTAEQAAQLTALDAALAGKSNTSHVHDAADIATGNLARARINDALSANAAPITATTVTASSIFSQNANGTAAEFSSDNGVGAEIYTFVGTAASIYSLGIGIGAAIYSDSGTAATIASSTGPHLDVGSGKMIVQNNGTVDLYTPLPIASGGTGGNTPGAARTALGLDPLFAAKANNADIFDFFRQSAPVGATGSAGNWTWTVPVGVKMLYIETVGGGAGGGSGRRGLAGTNRFGGGGGGGSGKTIGYFPRATLPSGTLNIQVGAGGAGGPSVSVNDTNGSPGSAGGGSQVSSAGVRVQVCMANQGATSVSNSGVGQGGTMSSGNPGGGAGISTFSGGVGGASQVTRVADGSVYSNTSCSGGAGGGGVDSANVQRGGGVGFGSGGNGGAGNASGAGVAGTDAGVFEGIAVFGGGGGGGGASLNDFPSGAGGKGGDGFVRIIVFY